MLHLVTVVLDAVGSQRSLGLNSENRWTFVSLLGVKKPTRGWFLPTLRSSDPMEVAPAHFSHSQLKGGEGKLGKTLWHYVKKKEQILERNRRVLLPSSPFPPPRTPKQIWQLRGSPTQQRPKLNDVKMNRTSPFGK